MLFGSLRNSGVFKTCWPFIYWTPSLVFLSSHFYVKTITGQSMQPTLNPDTSVWRDVVLFSKLPVLIKEGYGRDDIVTIRSPFNPKSLLIKRVVATEGDTVKTLPPYPDFEVTIPQGHVWVEGQLYAKATSFSEKTFISLEGDEHFNSGDSNSFGPVSKGLVEAKMLMIIWPPQRFGSINMAADSSETFPLTDEQKREAARHARVSRVQNLPSPTSASMTIQ